MSKKEEVSDTSKVDETKAPGNQEVLVEIMIDPVATDGGLYTNERRMVGKVKVSRDEADDIMRRLQEYAEVKNKLHNPNQKIRLKNHSVIEQLYLADPAENSFKPGWTAEYGLLDPWQWQWLTPIAQKQLKDLRYNLFGI